MEVRAQPSDQSASAGVPFLAAAAASAAVMRGEGRGRGKVSQWQAGEGVRWEKEGADDVGKHPPPVPK